MELLVTNSGGSETLKGPRLRLAHLSEKYVDQFLEWRSHKDAQQHQPIQPLTRHQLLSFLKTRGPENLAELVHQDYVFIMEDIDRQLAVGWLTVEILSRQHGLARIGYTVDKPYWGRGYATAAVRILADMLFGQTPIARIEADCSVHNSASRKVLEKCGFRLVGVKHSYLVIRNDRTDHYSYELLRTNVEE